MDVIADLLNALSVISVLFLASLFPVRAESRSRGVVVFLGFFVGLLVLLTMVLLAEFCDVPAKYYAALVVFTGAAYALVASDFIANRFPSLGAITIDKPVVDVTSLPESVRSAVQPFVQDRWITEELLNATLAKATGGLDLLTLSIRYGTVRVKVAELAQRLAAQRDTFVAELAAKSAASDRIEAELSRAIRDRGLLLEALSSAQDENRELKRKISDATAWADAVARAAAEREASATTLIRDLQSKIQEHRSTGRGRDLQLTGAAGDAASAPVARRAPTERKRKVATPLFKGDDNE